MSAVEKAFHAEFAACVRAGCTPESVRRYNAFRAAFVAECPWAYAAFPRVDEAE